MVNDLITWEAIAEAVPLYPLDVGDTLAPMLLLVMALTPQQKMIQSAPHPLIVREKLGVVCLVAFRHC
jgi:hypothetical protein